MKNIIGLFLLFFVQISIAQELPTPPMGFEWVEAPEIKGAFLKPIGWHYKKYKQGETQGYFITKENIDKKGGFITGFTMNVIPGIPEKMSTTPTQFAKSFIRKASVSRKNLIKPWSRSMGPFNSYGVVIKNPDPEKGDYNTHNLVISNDNTGTVYIVIFEAPTKDWESSWKVGEVILNKLLIDSDI